MADSNQPITPLEALLYTSKAALAGTVAYVLCGRFFPSVGVWAVVTAMIVIQPFLHVSLRTSVVRVLANVIAAVVGGVASGVFGTGLAALVLGIILAGLICHYARLDEGLRAAYAAVAILTLMPTEAGWQGPVKRVFAVLIGCLCALLVNLLFDRVSQKLAQRRNKT